MSYLFLGLAIILAAVFIFAESWKTPLLALFLKALASFGFCALWTVVFYEKMIDTSSAHYLGALDVSWTPIALLFGLALVGGLIGDLILALRPLRPKVENDSIILAGIAAFFTGHIFYLAALISLNRFSWIPFLFSLVTTVAVFMGSKKMKLEWGKSLIPSLLYSALIFLMIGQAFFNLIDQPVSVFNGLVFGGAMLFGVSDLILSQIYFKPKYQMRLLILNLSTYYAAQILLAFSLLFFR